MDIRSLVATYGGAYNPAPSPGRPPPSTSRTFFAPPAGMPALPYQGFPTGGYLPHPPQMPVYAFPLQQPMGIYAPPPSSLYNGTHRGRRGGGGNNKHGGSTLPKKRQREERSDDEGGPDGVLIPEQLDPRVRALLTMTPEEIQKYREERKKRYPTKENMAKKAADQPAATEPARSTNTHTHMHTYERGSGRGRGRGFERGRGRRRGRGTGRGGRDFRSPYADAPTHTRSWDDTNTQDGSNTSMPSSSVSSTSLPEDKMEGVSTRRAQQEQEEEQGKRAGEQPEPGELQAEAGEDAPEELSTHAPQPGTHTHEAHTPETTSATITPAGEHTHAHTHTRGRGRGRGRARAPCKYFAAGNCRWGRACHFSHDTEGLTPTPEARSSVPPPTPKPAQQPARQPTLMQKLVEQDMRRQYPLILDALRYIVDHNFLQT